MSKEDKSLAFLKANRTIPFNININGMTTLCLLSQFKHKIRHCVFKLVLRMLLGAQMFLKKKNNLKYTSRLPI